MIDDHPADDEKILVSRMMALAPVQSCITSFAPVRLLAERNDSHTYICPRAYYILCALFFLLVSPDVYSGFSGRRRGVSKKVAHDAS